MIWQRRRYHSGLCAALFISLLLSACGGQLYHVVQRGETLYSIGWAYGYDYREIARWNDLNSPYVLNPGQRLRVAPPSGSRVAVVTDRSAGSVSEKSAPPQITVIAPERPPVAVEQRNKALEKAGVNLSSDADPAWRWPTRNRNIVQTYSAKDPARQGVDISDQQGSPIYAAADGYVVYAGSGLVRYGRLIIIKHNEKYLSAYAHNHTLSVTEGEVVKAGQKIADMGSTGTNQPKLHFEIRQNGKPVDPLHYLPK